MDGWYELLLGVDGLVLEPCVSDPVEPCDLGCDLLCNLSKLYVSGGALLLEPLPEDDCDVVGLEVCDVSWS